MSDFTGRASDFWGYADKKGMLTDPASKVIVQESCRVIQRLDYLDSLIETNENWAFAECRQQQMVLKHLLVELRQWSSNNSEEENLDVSNLAERVAKRKPPPKN